MENTGKQFRKRNAILACLRESKIHPSAEELHSLLRKEHPDISLASVYRNLSFFKSQGLIISLGTVNGIERFDGRMDPHIHFACTCCGRVEDVPELLIPTQIPEDTERMLGCTVEDSCLMLSGRCRDCLSKERIQN